MKSIDLFESKSISDNELENTKGGNFSVLFKKLNRDKDTTKPRKKDSGTKSGSNYDKNGDSSSGFDITSKQTSKGEHKPKKQKK